MARVSRTSILLAVRGLDAVGTGRQVELLATGLAASGRRVEVASLSAGGSLPVRLEAAGIPVHRLGRRPRIDAAAATRLLRLATRRRPAVLVACGRGLAGVAAAVRLATGTPTVAHVAVPRLPLRVAPALARLDLVVAATRATADACRRWLPPERVVVVPPGARAEEAGGPPRVEIAAALGLDAARPWIVCVAPLVAASRLERLLWGIDQLRVVRPDVQHLLVGAGPMLRRLRRRAFVQEIADRLVVVPHTPLLPAVLDHAAVVWQPGSVPFGGAILDAMVRGVPAVAVESDAARQLVVDGVTGRIVPAEPESEFPRRAFGVLEDPALGAAFGAAGRARAAAEFPAAALVASFARALESLA
jgi:glycosyltransferase involved in cell wall biosynthesis